MIEKIIIGFALVCFLVASPLYAHSSVAEAPTQLPPVVAPKTPHEYVVQYASVYHSSLKQLLAVMSCESGGNPKAWNKNDPHGGSKGMFQFQDSTFLNYSKAIDIENPDIWNPEQQAEVAAYMFSKGMQSQWSCSYITGIL